MSQGLNQYQDHKAIAALAVTNPEPHMLKWLKERTQLPEETLYRAFRIHNVYQACGRTAIRNWGNTDQVTFLVVGKEDALFLHELFNGSTWLGQVGDIGNLKELRNTHNSKVPLADNPCYNQLRAEYKRLKSKRKPKEVDVSRLREVATAIATLKLGLKGS